MSKKIGFVYKRNWYSKAFVPVLLSRHRYLIVFGGRGSGKTNHIILKLLSASFQRSHTSIYYCRHEFETIRKTTFKDILNYLKNNPELDQFFSYSSSINGSMVFTNTITGAQIAPFGLDDPEKTKGISEATIVWIDEIDKCNFEQFAMINSVLRTPKAEYLQFIGSFNPVSEKHWLRSHFFSEADAYRSKESFGNDLMVHHSTVYDNEYIDVDEYVKTLELTYAGNQNALRVNLKGLWGNEENKSPWLYNFDLDKHVVADIPLLPKYPVYLSFDFNRQPLSCVASQMSPIKGGKGAFIHHIKEFCDDIQLSEMCERIKATFPASILFVTGDASGNKGDVAYQSRNSTQYTMIKSLLGISNKQMHINSKNLEHADSRQLMNMMFYHYPTIKISAKGCPNLINDCEIAEVDDKSSTPSKLRKDRDKFKMDLFDAMRYFYQTYFNDFVRNTYFLTK